MSVRTPRTPSYRLHKPSGQAVVTLGGRDHYLGKFGTPESRTEYDRLMSEWFANGRHLSPPPTNPESDLTVNELILAYLQHADGYYRKDGAPTSEPRNIRIAMRPVRQLYGHTRAVAFGPLAVKAVRQAMISAGLCRTEINKRIGRIVRAFRWAAEGELIPAAVPQALKTVAGLRKGRCEARESEPVGPVPDAHIDAVRPYVARQIWAMIELQRLTGMRGGEVTIMRTIDLDTSGQVWSYVPARHKTAHHGKRRIVPIGPRAQEILKPWLRTDLEGFLFSPLEAMEERRAEARRNRKTPLTPSQRARGRSRRPRRAPGDHYLVTSYAHAIATACRKADVPHWHPHQIRHNAGTRLRKEFGLDVARAVLGHCSPAVTEIYAELDAEKAKEAMQRIG